MLIAQFDRVCSLDGSVDLVARDPEAKFPSKPSLEEEAAFHELVAYLDSLTLTPKRISATSLYTMEGLCSLIQLIDQLIRTSQARKIGEVLDDNAMGGSGSGANPRGILKPVASIVSLQAIPQ